jgi:AcrR family transcriptional regulator
MPRTDALLEDGKEPASQGAQTRERLRQLALDLFWEKGYRKTSTRDLAAALGVKQASLYYHVKNKEELLYDICSSSLQHVIEQVEAAAHSTTDPLEALAAIARTHMVATLEQQRQMLVSMYDYRSLSAGFFEEINIFWTRYELMVTRIYDQAIVSGQMRSGIPHKYHYHAVMSMTNWSVLWYRPDGELPLAQLAQFFSTIYLEGARAPGARFDLGLGQTAISAHQAELRPICVTKNETHARLLDISSMLFATGGFTTTSIREVADAMGIEKASLYYYITSKDDLCYQIIRSAHEHMLTSARNALEGVVGAEARLLRFIVAHVDALLEHKNWFAVANEQINFLDARKRAEMVGLRDAYELMVRQILADAVAAGLLRADVPVRYLGFALLGMITHIYPWYQEGVDPQPQALAVLLADFFLHGIRAPHM